MDHSHRPTTKTTHKAFKSKHASKSAVKNAQKGKVEAWERSERGARKTPHQQVMSKFDRKNRAKQLRLHHAHDRDDKASVFVGSRGAPRIVAVVPLCADIDVQGVLRQLNASVDVEEEEDITSLWIPRFKQRVRYLAPTDRDLISCLDACRVADFVLFVLSANEEVDERGEQMLRCIEAQGVSTVLAGVYALDQVEPAKKRPDVLKSLKSFITHFFATLEKVHDLDNRQDCSNIMRSLCTTLPKGIRWREDRSWMLIEESALEGESAVVTGVVRGRGLKADRLVQVGEWGDLEIDKITAAPLKAQLKKSKLDDMAMDPEQILGQPGEERDDLAELAPEEANMVEVPATSVGNSERKAVLLDDHYYFHDDARDAAPAPKRLPRGTSNYQAAWYLGDVSDSGSDLEDVEDGSESEFGTAGDATDTATDGRFEDKMDEGTEAGGPSEYPQSEAFLDQAPEEETAQIEAYRKQRRDDAAEDDLEFPDEIELHPHVNARERLARYRGLKSLRTSHWETEEDKPYEPEEYSRLLEISDYKSAKNRVLKEAITGGVQPGTRVKIHLRIPQHRRSELEALPQPTTLFSLLRHEHKRTVVNVSISLSSDCSEPIKSKTPLIMQCGLRRLLVRPLFSAGGNTPNNVHKFERYLHPGRTAVATFIGPVTWGSIPCIFFKTTSASQPLDPIEDLALSLQNNANPRLEMIATGTTLPPSTQRIIAKRIILTGHPYKIHKKLVTVRYMFFSAEDVQYFRALQLWTKRGRSGFIKETLGTHGYFKATFDGKVNPLDAVAVSLYKRVWPRLAQEWRPSVEANHTSDDEVPKLMEVD